MSNINWNRPKYVPNGTRAWDSKLEKPLPIQHEGHHLLTTMTTGPHYAKLICMTCGGKFVKWLNREQYQMYK
jgi:hypothetical protein